MVYMAFSPTVREVCRLIKEEAAAIISQVEAGDVPVLDLIKEYADVLRIARRGSEDTLLRVPDDAPEDVVARTVAAYGWRVVSDDVWLDRLAQTPPHRRYMSEPEFQFERDFKIQLSDDGRLAFMSRKERPVAAPYREIFPTSPGKQATERI